VLAQRVGHVLEHAHGVKHRAALEHHRHVAPQLAQLLAVHVADLLALEQDVAALVRQQPDHQLEAHALAHAGAADDREGLALFDLEVHVLIDDVGAEGLVQVA
jgi:hypothetical protein